MKSPLSEKRIVIGVTGSIAAYKACEIVRGLRKQGAEVRVIMTQNAAHFVTPLTFQTLSQNDVLMDMFSYTKGWVPEHIGIADWAQALLVAPATANMIGKAAAGIADDLLSSTILSVVCPIVFAPAMNFRMYEGEVVQTNVRTLTKRGYRFIGPEKGFLADGHEGRGRMSEPEDIIEMLKQLFTAPK
jgi:phosphopantothenoylcysteine decarboxylase/phosphopantothenate--cysteine ligase